MKAIPDLVKGIVEKAEDLHLRHCSEGKFPVNYVCVFSHTDDEFNSLVAEINKMGRVVLETAMGPVYLLENPVKVSEYQVEMVKIRKPDAKRAEIGDADFTASDYESFKSKYQGQKDWNLIVRPEMEMLELMDPDYDVLVYYSHPTLAETLGIIL